MSNLQPTGRRIGVCTSDWHLTAEIPVHCQPSFTATQQESVEQILWLCKDYADEGNRVYLLNAGDIYDTARVPRWLSSNYLALLGSPMFTESFAHIVCAGQHDQLYHSKKLDDTSIHELYSSGCIQRFGPGVKTLDWGDELDKEYTGVLVAHICCTPSDNPFIDYSVSIKKLMRQTKAKVIVTGDYHKAHHYEEEGRIIVNPGSLTRLAADEINRQPSVYVVDLDTAELIEQVFLDVPPAEEAFFLDRIDEKKEKEERKEELSHRFDDYLAKVKEKKIKPDFDKVLGEVVKEDKPDEEVKQMIEECM